MDRRTHTIAARDGHFLLESGLHTDRWFDLDRYLREPHAIDAGVARLATLLLPFAPSLVCGPLVGGARVAEALGERLDIRSVSAHRVATNAPGHTFTARYALSTEEYAMARGRRVALVDDMISAGSATRATLAALNDAGATVVVVGALFLSGDVGALHFESLGIPVRAVERRGLSLWSSAECPLCRRGVPLDDSAP